MMDIVITGASKSGKTSIKKVVFEKMSPYESVFNETTEKAEEFKVESLGYCKLKVTEFPTNFFYEKSNDEYEKILSTCGALIFVLNSQESTNQQYEYFKNNIMPIFGKYKSISLSVFIHKKDNTNISPSDFNKQKGEIQTKFKQMLTQYQKEASLKEIVTNFYVTSIYNSTLFETFSKIFQNMMPQNKILSILIDELTNSCRFEKAYLFDVFNKIYLAVDTSPTESPQTYEICSDIIDVVLDMSGIYGDESNIETESYFDDNSTCAIKISNVDKEESNSKSILCLKFIDYSLALIAIINEEEYERTNLVDYNVNIFRQAVRSILNKN